MRNYFQAPQFARVGKLFQDIPIETIERATEGFNQMYSNNMSNFSKLDAAMNAIQVSGEDDYVKRQKIDALREEMKRFAENDGFENADAFIGSKTADFLGDRDLTHLQENYKLRQLDEETARQLRAQGISPIDARNLLNGENFSSISYDEMGNKKYNTYQGGYMRPGDYDKVKQTLFDDMPQRGGTFFKPGPNGSMIEVTSTGIWEKDIADYAEAAMDRYRSTDTYRTEIMDMKARGMSDEEAEAQVRKGLIAAGRERVGQKNDQRLVGYENTNVTAARQARLDAMARKAQTGKEESEGLYNRYIPQFEALNIGDPDGIGGIWGKKDRGVIPIIGRSTQPGDNVMKGRDLNGFYSVDPNNSETNMFADDYGTLQNKSAQVNARYTGGVRMLVSEDGQHLMSFGKGAMSNKFNGIPDSSVPQQKNGRWFVQDKDGNDIYMKERNMKEYIDGDGKHYYQPMNRTEEAKMMGEIVNSRVFEIGREYNGGARLADSFDYNGAQRMTSEIMYSPKGNELGARAAEQLIYKLESPDPIEAKVAKEILTRVGQSENMRNNPKSVLLAMMDYVKTNQKGYIDVKGNQSRTARAFTPEGVVLAKMLNETFENWEISRIPRQYLNPKVTSNEMDLDMDGFELEDE